jgi:hypothetical protein
MMGPQQPDRRHQMALFAKADPAQALRANIVRLTADLSRWQAATVERHMKARQLARDGADDTALDKAEAATRSAQDRAQTVQGALADVEQQLHRVGGKTSPGGRYQAA